MTKYDDLFDETTPTNNVFRDKRALDPLTEPTEILARDTQERTLARILHGVHDNYLPPTVSIYGPPGTGKTITTRRICREFADRTPELAVEYVNLKECRTLFSAANEIHAELTSTKLGTYEGIDGVFTGIWRALEDYPEWTILILDEIDHLRHDANYDPSDFFYRLLRGEGRLARDITLSVWLLSNDLVQTDLDLDSRVTSAMSDEAVYFPPYTHDELDHLLHTRLQNAFTEGALPEDVRTYGVTEAARRWGDARKTLTLFRQAGETANDHGLDTVTQECIEMNLETAEDTAIIEKLHSLPHNHLLTLYLIAITTDDDTPTTTSTLTQTLQQFDEETAFGQRRIRSIVTDLETMGFVDTWTESTHTGHTKHITPAIDPQLIEDATTRLRQTHDSSGT